MHLFQTHKVVQAATILIKKNIKNKKKFKLTKIQIKNSKKCSNTKFQKFPKIKKKIFKYKISKISKN